MEMNREKYVEELKKALIAGEESSGKYNFAISRDDESMKCLFSYERNLKDGSVSTIKCLNLLNCKDFLLYFCILLGSLKSNRPVINISDGINIRWYEYFELCHRPNQNQVY